MLGVVLGSGLAQGGLGSGRDLREAMQMMEQAPTGCLQLEEDDRQGLIPVGVDEGIVAGVHVDVAVREGAHADLLQGQAGFGDRKSTRLNSSHDQISYAVFCLKKKKNSTTRSSSPHSTGL